MSFAAKYVHTVDAVNYRIGRIMMYGIFVMVGILIWSSISKTFFNPSLWTLEIAQFALVTYYIMGGPYSIQLGSNVRMDLFYSEWTDHRKAQIDALTILFLLFYLGGFAAWRTKFAGLFTWTFQRRDLWFLLRFASRF